MVGVVNTLRQENETLKERLNTLIADIAPKIVGVADLDEEFVIRIKKWDYSGTDIENGSVKMDWKAIFMAIGSKLPIFYSEFDNTITKYIKENLDAKVFECFDTDIERVKFHLLALGLIKSSPIQGSFMLTAIGSSTLLEIMAVRSGRQATSEV